MSRRGPGLVSILCFRRVLLLPRRVREYSGRFLILKNPNRNLGATSGVPTVLPSPFNLSRFRNASSQEYTQTRHWQYMVNFHENAFVRGEVVS